MSKNERLSKVRTRGDAEFQTRNSDAVMTEKYYGGALFQLARTWPPGQMEYAYPGGPFMPSDFSRTIGDRPFTPAEYLIFLGERGFNVDEVKASVDEIHASVDAMRARARAFFKIFQTEWIISKTDFDKYLDSDSIHFFIELVIAESASTKARLKAIKRHTDDPKQKDKALVREWWNDWQKNDPTRYKNKSAFAKDMLDKFPNLESQRVIADKWCPAWEKENITLPAQ